MRICALVPVYNNAATVTGVVEGCLERVDDVIVVDDGSTDGSTRDLRARRGVHLVRLDKNQGKGEALRRGLGKADVLGFTHAIALDADGQHDPSHIPDFIAAIEQEPGAIIIGVRRMEEAGAPGSSRFGRSFSNFWYRVQTWESVDDAQCGYRAYPVRRTLDLETRSKRYTIEHEVIVLASWSGMPVSSNVPIDVTYGDDIVSHFGKFVDNAKFSALNASLTLARYSGAHRFLRRELSPPPGPPASKAPTWVRGKSLGNRPGYWWFGMLTRTAGVDAAYRFLDVVVSYYSVLAPREYRNASNDYLKRMFPEATPSELRRHRWHHFRQFGENVLDHALVPQLGLEGFNVGGEGLEHIETAAGRGKGLILLGAHFGPWQFGAAGLGGKGITVRIAAVIQEARAMDSYLSQLRSHSKHQMPEILLLDGKSPFASMTIADALEKGDVVALHADRHLLGRSIIIPFLGTPARFPLGPFVLSELTGAPLAIWFAVKHDRRSVKITVHEPFNIRPGSRRD
ncbi:MAG: glycosyltransferase family 2 protein, partial [Deltaproteobacteria bacterium]|nr:glycosyltransferase family 2 protein [Deltaproteobacteria bacterium]